MGDVRLETKFRILNDFKHPVGLAVRPYITFPTGDSDKLVGNGTITGGGDIIFDTHVGERFFASLKTGILIRENVSPANLNISEDDKFTYGLGLNVKATEIQSEFFP